MAITSAGLGSNLDVESIVKQLMTLEQKPLTALAKKEAAVQTKISALGSLKNALSSLQTAASALVPTAGSSSLQKFSIFNASFADTAIATASTTSSAVAGTYNLSNIVLATAQQVRKTGITVPAEAGTLSIQVGSGTAVDVTIEADSSLSNVMASINGANAGVSASIINDGSADHLVLTANSTGEANTIKITGSGTGWTGGEFDFNGTDNNNTWKQSTPANDATLTINNINVISASNTLSTAISGVTLNLTKAGSTTLTLTRDTSSLTAGINAFVKAYNEYNTTTATLGSYNATTKTAGSLNGDSTLRSAQSSMRSLIGSIPDGMTGADFQRLSDIGVRLQKDGSLLVDSSKLSTAITKNISGVANLVSAYGSAFKTATESLVGASGSIVSRTVGLNDSIRNLDKQYEAVSFRLTQIEARYRKQFSALDTMMSNMSTTSTFLSQQLANLPNLTLNNS